MAGNIHRSVPSTARALFNTLCECHGDIPLRLRIDIRAVAFQLHGYFFFQQNFQGSIENTSRELLRGLQEMSESDRPKYLFAFMETILEVCGPRELGQCITIICNGEPFLSEIIQCTAERDIVEFIATFAICCQVEPRQMYSDHLATTQLAVFQSIVHLIPPRWSRTQLFSSAARKTTETFGATPVMALRCRQARPRMQLRLSIGSGVAGTYSSKGTIVVLEASVERMSKA
jgi:hypothetical protein